MARFATFEVCGLHFILQPSGDGSTTGAQFQLCDEAFSKSPVRFSAKSYAELFLETEGYVGLTLNEETREALRSDLGDINMFKTLFGRGLRAPDQSAA